MNMQVLKDEVRDSIHKAALLEFRENGYHKASMRNIAKRAGIAVGNMYRYFKNKDELFYSVISPAYNKVIKFITEFKAPEYNSRELDNLSIDEQTRGIVDIYLEHNNELLIMIDGSKGTVYEKAKDEIVSLVQNIIYSFLKNKVKESSSVVINPLFSHTLSYSVIEGVILILKNYEDEETIGEMVKVFVGCIFKDIHNRIE